LAASSSANRCAIWRPASLAARAHDRYAIPLLRRHDAAQEEKWRWIGNLTQTARVILVVPPDQRAAQTRQFAQFLVERFEFCELDDILRGRTVNSRGDQFFFADLENPRRITELIEQHPRHSRANATHFSEREPISVSTG
jgi:hypothetical protein